MRFTFDEIEQFKQRYTDKLVAIDASRPELRRFEHATGRVKTVNMSGRALVQFDAYDNIGWYDIDLAFLRVIDQPLPKPEPKAAKAPAAKPAAGEKKAAPAAKAPAAAKPAAAAGGKKMSVAEMMAAARAQVAGGAVAPAAGASEKPAVAETAAVDSLQPVEKVAAPAAKEPKGKPSGPLPKNTPDILAWCRQTDGK